MADPAGPDNTPQPPRPGDDVPIEEGLEPMEVEAVPRRAASARFVVEAEVGSAAALREAMDPANQSLADALRLSFRVLQVVIVVLIVLFMISGFRTVKAQESGVMLRFGGIVGVPGEQALEPGLRRNLLPYPAGEFVIFPVENLSIDLGDTYWPKIPENVTLERAIERANVKSVLKPGEVGTVVTSDGDLAHLKLRADYVIDDPVRYVETVKLSDARRVVELALERAVVRATASMTLQQLVEEPEDIAARIEDGAQGVLNSIGCGIRLTSVQMSDTKPPFAIVKVYRDLQNAREEAREMVEKARQEADEQLIKAAGLNFAALSDQIDRYEEAVDLGDDAAAETRLTEINDFLDSGEARGDVLETIQKAKAYEYGVESTLGKQAQRFRAILPQYLAQPVLTARRLWVEARKAVMGRDDVEIIRVPVGLGTIDVTISGSEEIARLRQKERERRRERQSQLEAAGIIQPYQMRAQDFEPGEARPSLEATEEGGVRPRGSER
jgi:membrane protease subunit HflK